MFSRLKDKITYYRDHYFVRNVATLQVGTVIETAIQATSGILMARLLQPERFGVYTLAFGLAGLISVLLGAGALDAITTIAGATYARKDAVQTRDALAYLLKISVLAGIIALIVTLFAPWVAGNLYHDRSIGLYAAILVVAALVTTTFFSVTTLGLQLAGRIKVMMALGVADQFVRFGLSVLLVFLGYGVLGAAVGHLAGAVIIFFASVALWKHLRRADIMFPKLRALVRSIWNVPIRKYLGPSIWITVDRNLGMLYGILPVLMTGIFVLPGEVTYFKLAFGYVNLAMTLLGPVATLLNVEFPKMLEVNRASLRKNFIKVSLYATGLSAALTAGSIAVAPLAFRILYGASYLPSVKYAAGLFVYGAFYGIGIGLGAMWRAINKVKVSIIINCVVLGTGVPAGLWLMKAYGLWGAVITVTSWYTISHLVSFAYISRELKLQIPSIK